MSTDESKNDDQKKKSSGTDDFPIQEYKLVPIGQEEYSDSDDELNLAELIKTIWENRKTVYKFVGAGFLLGILFAILSPKEYVSSATLMPEYSTDSQSGASSLLQQYGGLIGLSGGSYSANSNAIRVELYPRIVESLTFQDNLARQEFYFSDYDTTTSLYTYYMEVKSPGVFGYVTRLIGAVFNLFKGQENDIKSATFEDGIMSLTEQEMLVIDDLRERVTANLDDESGIISVSAKMRDPKLAAEVAKYTIEELTLYLTEYRTEKVNIDLDFVKEQLDAAEERFLQAQLAKAEYEDSNQGSQTARANTERERLQSEFNLAFNVYNTLSQQYEEAKIKVQEETPVFKVLQPVQVPVKDETSGAVILIIFIMMSGVVSTVWIFIKQFIKSDTISVQN